MADSLRLSPVFERVQSDPLSNMEGLNPERALRLLQPRSPEMPTNISVGPRMSGSNALSLGVATSQKQSGVKKELSPSQNGRGAQPLVHLPKNPTLVIAGVKRPRDHLDNSESYAQKHPCSNPPSFPPLCILGWDSGGWYPEWWEYVKFFEARTAPENQDWYDYARDIFVETFPNELVAYQGIARCQRQ
ncbi:hypothetical protein TrVFT333_006164 [Trichoderma virens FT-333]|nr:hypothetical protein TrVFT333_006164 [Trichoderma virens FT-333]